MSKIICDVCGTSYPEASSQCPICGCVRPAAGENSYAEMEEAAGYTYVKGGRFSKSNVRKRVKTAPVEEIDEYGPAEDYEPERKKSEAPLVITAIILLLVIAAIVVFITLRFFGPWAEKPADDEYEQTQTSTQETTDDGIIVCTKLEVSDYEIQIPEGGTYELKVVKEPADTTDEVTYESKDPTVAEVDENGRITPVSTGTTTIVITCGEQTVEVSVSCQVKEETPFMLDHMELKLTYLDQEWILYSGEAPTVDEITFSSDDEAVATFVAGVVYAKGPGETVVRAQYGDLMVSCKVSCVFDDSQTDTEDPGVSEDGGNTEPDTGGTNTEELLTTAPKATGTKGYTIKTQFGNAYGTSPKFDVSHVLEGVLYFKLVDAYGSRVSATWKIYNTSICSLSTDDGVAVTCLSKGTAYLVATTEDGETYVCTIRVD